MVEAHALKLEAFKKEKPIGLFIHKVDITNSKDVEDLNTIINSFDNLDYQRNTSLGFHRFYSRGGIINVQSIADTFSCVLSDKASMGNWDYLKYRWWCYGSEKLKQELTNICNL